MKKLPIIFIIYILVNFAYFALLNSGIDFGIVYTTWNEITMTVLTVLSVTFLYISLFSVYKIDLDSLKKNLILIAITIVYSGILYYIVYAQIFMLKG
jgi:hypothetical protein